MIWRLLLFMAVLTPFVANADPQGIYLGKLTYTTADDITAYVSANAALVTMTTTEFTNDGPPIGSAPLSGAVVDTQSVNGTEQTDGLKPYINAEWSRTETIPAQPSGIYMVEIPSTNVVPAVDTNVTGGPIMHNYKTPLFVVPSAGETYADILLVTPSLTSHCYNTYGGKSCYTHTVVNGVVTNNAQPDFGPLRPGFHIDYIDDLRKVAKLINRMVPRPTWDACDEQYIEENPDFLLNYNGVMVVEQPEYVVPVVRKAFEDYTLAGGRTFFFGNEFWIYQVRNASESGECAGGLCPAGTYRVYKVAQRVNTGTDPVTLTYLKDPYHQDSDITNDHLVSYQWANPLASTPDSAGGPDNPEISFLGTSLWLGWLASGRGPPQYAAGPGGNDPTDSSQPFIYNLDWWDAWRTGHWFYDETTLTDGDPFREQQFGALEGFVEEDYLDEPRRFPPTSISMIDGVTARWNGGLPFPYHRDALSIDGKVMILATIPTTKSRRWDCVSATGHWSAADDCNSSPSGVPNPGYAAITIKQTVGDGVVMVIPDKRWHRTVGTPASATENQLLRNVIAKFASPDVFDPFGGYSVYPPIALQAQ